MNFLPFSPHLPFMAVELGISETGIKSHMENSTATSPSSVAGSWFSVRADLIYAGDRYEC